MLGAGASGLLVPPRAGAPAFAAECCRSRARGRLLAQRCGQPPLCGDAARGLRYRSCFCVDGRARLAADVADIGVGGVCRGRRSGGVPARRVRSPEGLRGGLRCVDGSVRSVTPTDWPSTATKWAAVGTDDGLRSWSVATRHRRGRVGPPAGSMGWPWRARVRAKRGATWSDAQRGGQPLSFGTRAERRRTRGRRSPGVCLRMRLRKSRGRSDDFVSAGT